MSDVREQLVLVIGQAIKNVAAPDPWEDGIADAILVRWDLTPKPVVTDAALGDMAGLAVNATYWNRSDSGFRLKKQLAERGLTIVRMEEGTR